MDLPLEDGEAFRYLPPALRGYVQKWFDVLAPTDVLHWNGLWKSKFYGRTFTVTSAANQPEAQEAERRSALREITIRSKTELMEFLAASHKVPVRTLYTRRQELLEFYRYLGECRKAGREPDGAEMARIFPSWSKNGAERRSALRPRADRGVSKSVTPEVQQWLLAHLAGGSKPGKAAGARTLIGMLRELETLREFLALQGADPDAAGLTVPSVSALRRWMKAQPESAKGPPVSDPAVLWSQRGSKKFHELVVPSTPRIPPLCVHDWWEGKFLLRKMTEELGSSAEYLAQKIVKLALRVFGGETAERMLATRLWDRFRIHRAQDLTPAEAQAMIEEFARRISVRDGIDIEKVREEIRGRNKF